MAEIVKKAPQNEVGSKPVEGHSTFELNQNIAGTYRFGEYGINFVEDTVPNDVLPLKSSHEIRSMNLKAPLLGEVQIHKEFFDVPYTVMLPLNYDKLFTQPVIGDDIDAQEVGTNIEKLDAVIGTTLKTIIQNTQADFANGIIEAEDYLGFILRTIATLDSVYSTGSLLAACGIDFSSKYAFKDTNSDIGDPNEYYTWDYIINYLYEEAKRCIQDAIDRGETGSTGYMAFTIDHAIFWVNPSVESGERTNQISFRELVEKVKDASSVKVAGTPLTDGGNFLSDVTMIETILAGLNIGNTSGEKDINLGRPLAYQLACAEFYTNSHVDYIYSAELYRQNIDNLLFTAMGLTRDTFTMNGIHHLYDTLSAHELKKGLSFTTDFNLTYDLYRLIFGYNRSLRYVDYFTGARTRPLAVGDVNVAVNNGYVNVIDTIEKRWAAKFYNQVNRAGRKISEYMAALFPGLKMDHDWHDPLWLAQVTDDVNIQETENTGAAQVSQANSTTSNFTSNASRYAFEYKAQYYGIIIGITSFDIKRYYPHIIERNVFNVDRNDFFNPFLQFTGDQKIYKDELDSSLSHSTFGYTGRDNQYKVKVDRCFGGFSEPENLPGWLFTAQDSPERLGEGVQGPDYIRSRASELDRFYSSLIGYSEGTYYHFIIINRNVCNARRPMIANPQLD